MLVSMTTPIGHSDRRRSLWQYHQWSIGTEASLGCAWKAHVNFPLLRPRALINDQYLDQQPFSSHLIISAGIAGIQCHERPGCWLRTRIQPRLPHRRRLQESWPITSAECARRPWCRIGPIL